MPVIANFGLSVRHHFVTKTILEVKSVYLEKGARSIDGPKLSIQIDGYVRFHAKPADLPMCRLKRRQIRAENQPEGSQVNRSDYSTECAGAGG
jgi:hypothetical protein